MTEFDDQYIEGNDVVRKAPRATLDALLSAQVRREAEASVALDRDETHVVGEPQSEYVDAYHGVNGPDEPLPDKPKLAELLTEEDKIVIAKLSTEDEKAVAHALEILPHLGPDVTAAYLKSKAGDETGEHEERRE